MTKTIRTMLETAGHLRGLANMNCPQGIRDALHVNADNLERVAANALVRRLAQGREAANALDSIPDPLKE